MSGIAVIWNLDGRPVEHSQLGQMTQLMEHRGPDGETHWFQGAIAIGHCALNTTAEDEGEKLPLPGEAAVLYLTFDGRIDNRKELQLLLDIEASGSRSRPVTDAELVLAAYRKWGEDCPVHLLGDFAFALWDGRRKRLFCARDCLGVRPFFYALAGNTFVCASEIRALYAVPSLKKDLNLAILTLRVMGRSVEYADTLYEGVSRLPMAHCLTVSQEGVRQRRYWDIDPGHQVRYRTDDEYAEHFRALFFEAVGSRLRSQAPIAALLSGGLDSSSIVCAAAQIRREGGTTQPNLEAFSMVFDRFSCDERPFIDEVIRHSGVTANFHVGDRDLGEAALANIVRYPGLLYSPQVLSLGVMFQGLRERNFRVLLDGNGGDQLGGNGIYHLLPLMQSGRWLSLASQIRQFALTYGVSPWRVFLVACLKPSIPAPVKSLYWNLARRNRKANPGLSLVPTDALDRTGARDRLEQKPPMPDFESPFQHEMYTSMFTGMAPIVVTEGYELLTAFSGLEPRQPFRDRRLVEFAMGLPADQLWRNGWSRFCFRNAMHGILPEKIARRRGKAEFSEHYESVLAGSQAREVRALLHDSVLTRLGVLDPEALKEVVERYQKAPGMSSSLQVSELVALDLMCREFLGEPGFPERYAGNNAKSSAQSNKQ